LIIAPALETVAGVFRWGITSWLEAKMIGALINLLIYLIIVGIIYWAVITILPLIPLPAPIAQIVRVILIVILALIIIYALLGLLPAAHQPAFLR
jgi:hypothetical protein